MLPGDLRELLALAMPLGDLRELLAPAMLLGDLRALQFLAWLLANLRRLLTQVLPTVALCARLRVGIQGFVGDINRLESKFNSCTLPLVGRGTIATEIAMVLGTHELYMNVKFVTHVVLLKPDLWSHSFV